jgi:drug/metabolite transporter (DMT)-like permease
MPPNTRQNGRINGASIVALLLLSMLGAGSALKSELMPDLTPGPLPHFQKQILPLAMLALAAGATALLRGEKWRCKRQLQNGILIGLGLFAVPDFLVYLSHGYVPAVSRTALFTLVPLFSVIFAPYFGDGSAVQDRGELLAALAAVAGALLVFPLAIPTTLQANATVVAVILATACAAAANCQGVAEATRPDGRPAATLAATVAVAGLTGAIALATLSALLEPNAWTWGSSAPGLLWSAALEFPSLCLLFWLMPRMSATRMAARYLLAPLITVLVGAAALQSLRDLRLRTWLGLLMMAAGSAWILLVPDGESSSSGSSLNLDRQ